MNHRKHGMGKLTACLLALALGTAVAPGAASAQETSGGCTSERDDATGVHLTLCVPQGGANDLDVLVHGATYNSTYWDWPTEGSKYSYVKRTLQAGRAVLSYDQLGAGQSDHPSSLQVSLKRQADVLHSLITRKASGYRVTVVGHSLGSMVAVNEAARYHDVSRLVLTGYLHPPAVGPRAQAVFASFYPARRETRFAGRDLGYLTTRPGTRQASFYAGGIPAGVAQDEERLKDVQPAGVLVGGALHTGVPAPLNEARRITADVDVVVGQLDGSVCGGPVDCTNDAALTKNESGYFSSARSLSAKGIPNTGHSVALHESADVSFTAIDSWIRAHAG